MFDFKRLLSLLFFSLISFTSFGAYKTTHVRQSVAYDAFPPDVKVISEVESNKSGHHTEGSFPQTFVPQNPLHDDDDKFQMRCQSDEWSVYDCSIDLTLTVQWNFSVPNKLKTCSLKVNLTADGSGDNVYYTHRRHYLDDNDDCSLDEKKIDGVNVWVVHPKTIAGKRTTTVKFKGTFTDTQAATWADQIYRNLAPSLKDQVGLYTPSYELNSDKTELTFTMPAYFEAPYTCQDWC